MRLVFNGFLEELDRTYVSTFSQFYHYTAVTFGKEWDMSRNVSMEAIYLMEEHNDSFLC